jgi:hypothetical protein
MPTELTDNAPAFTAPPVEAASRPLCDHYHSEVTGSANSEKCTGRCRLYQHNSFVSHVCGTCGKSW